MSASCHYNSRIYLYEITTKTLENFFFLNNMMKFPLIL